MYSKHQFRDSINTNLIKDLQRISECADCMHSFRDGNNNEYGNHPA